MTIDFKQIRAILFDIDGTLFSPSRCLRRVPISEIPEFVPRDPDLIAAICHLKNHVSLGILSDGSRARQSAKLNALGLTKFFEVIVFSQDIRAQKPSSISFTYALKLLSHPPGQTLYVGDHPFRDIAGARACGLHTCWTSWGKSYPDTSIKPDLIIERPHQLTECIPCPSLQIH